MNLICLLFGHSGQYICDRCGETTIVKIGTPDKPTPTPPPPEKNREKAICKNCKHLHGEVFVISRLTDNCLGTMVESYSGMCGCKNYVDPVSGTPVYVYCHLLNANGFCHRYEAKEDDTSLDSLKI